MSKTGHGETWVKHLGSFKCFGEQLVFQESRERRD